MSANPAMDPASELRESAAEESRRDGDHGTLDTSARRVYRLIDDNLHAVGGIETAAGMLGIDRGDLRRALDHKGRYLPVEHAMAIAQRMRWHRPSIAVEICAAIVLPVDLLVWPRVEQTHENAELQLRAQLERFGDAGREAAASVPRGRK